MIRPSGDPRPFDGIGTLAGHNLPVEAIQAHISTIEALAEALEARDPYTAGHGVRVAACAVRIAQALGVPTGEVEMLRVGAKLHDIGKLGIPDSILLKPTVLTEQESGFMQVHTGIGRRILAKVPGFGPLLAVVELHHENLDGSGYPHGLRGDDIPLLARIVRVADVFDAMITDRVYRVACNPERAIEHIVSRMGREFDPDVVAAFRNIVCDADYASAVTEDSLGADGLVIPA